MIKVLILLVIGLFIYLLIWSVKWTFKQSQKDWAIYRELEKRAYELKTKEEIEKFHEEFIGKAKKISNDLISPKLLRLDGYIRGLYEQYKKEK